MNQNNILTVQTPSQRLHAQFKPTTVNEESKTVTAIISTEAKVRRYPFFDEPFDEVLDMSAANLERMANLPVLKDHVNSVDSVIGTVERVWLNDNQLLAELRFSSDDDDIKKIWTKVREGILKNISIGYNVEQYTEEKNARNDNVRVLRASKWTLLEVSLVGVGADPNAHIRRNDDQYTTTIILKNEENTMPQVQPATTPPTNIDTIEMYKKRMADIATLCSDHGMSDQLTRFMQEDKTVEDVRSEILTHYTQTRNFKPSDHTVLDITKDEREKTVEHMRDALLHRVDSSKPLHDKSKIYRGMSLVDLAKDIIQSHGRSVRGLTNYEIAQRAFDTNEFAHIMEGFAKIRLEAGYDTVAMPFKHLVSYIKTPDFRPIKTLSLGNLPEMPEIPRNTDELQTMAMADSGQVYNIKRRGVIVNISNVTIVNDDLNYVNASFSKIGRSGALAEVNSFYNIFNQNLPISVIDKEGHIKQVPLFSEENGNVLMGAPSKEMFKKIKLIFQNRKEDDFMRLPFVSIMSSTDLEDDINAIIHTVDVTGSSKGNMYSDLKQFSDPSIQEGTYYGFTDPNARGIVEFAHLVGFEKPFLESHSPFAIDGIQLKGCYHFGCSPMHYESSVRVTLHRESADKRRRETKVTDEQTTL